MIPTRNFIEATSNATTDDHRKIYIDIERIEAICEGDNGCCAIFTATQAYPIRECAEAALVAMGAAKLLSGEAKP